MNSIKKIIDKNTNDVSTIASKNITQFINAISQSPTEKQYDTRNESKETKPETETKPATETEPTTDTKVTKQGSSIPVTSPAREQSMNTIKNVANLESNFVIFINKICLYLLTKISYRNSYKKNSYKNFRQNSYRNSYRKNSYRNLIGKIPIRIDNSTSSYRLFFYLDKKDEIYHYSSKEHPKISKIAKFDCKML